MVMIDYSSYYNDNLVETKRNPGPTYYPFDVQGTIAKIPFTPPPQKCSDFEKIYLVNLDL